MCTRVEGPQAEFRVVPVEPASGETTRLGTVLRQAGDTEPVSGLGLLLVFLFFVCC